MTDTATVPQEVREAWEEMGRAERSRDYTIKAIRDALKRRSGRQWSVTGGRGTAWGWIEITAPPARRLNGGSCMNDDDRAELARLLGLPGIMTHHQGVSVAASHAYYREYIARALTGESCGCDAQPYWED